MTSQVGSQAVAVTSPAKSMAAVAWKGAPSGRGYSFATPISAVQLPESWSRLRLDRLSGSRTALWASQTNGLPDGWRTASVSQPRQQTQIHLRHTIHSPPWPNLYKMTTNTGRRTYDTSTCIRSTWAKDTGNYLCLLKLHFSAAPKRKNSQS